MKLHEDTKKQKGFTIVEIVLVLAIAALIFLVVFLAFTQLQRTRRDHQRKLAANQVLANLESYFTNNGHYPRTATEQAAFTIDYSIEIFDPGGTDFDVAFSQELYNTHTSLPEPDEILYTYQHWCVSGGGDPVDGDHRGQTVVVLAYQESGRYYCTDSR